MKKVLFYVSFPFLAMLAIMLACIEFIATCALGFVAMTEALAWRWECWIAGVKPGELLNCPWKKSIIEVFGDVYQERL